MPLPAAMRQMRTTLGVPLLPFNGASAAPSGDGAWNRPYRLTMRRLHFNISAQDMGVLGLAGMGQGAALMSG